jgi:hypothetical protein
VSRVGPRHFGIFSNFAGVSLVSGFKILVRSLSVHASDLRSLRFAIDPMYPYDRLIRFCWRSHPPFETSGIVSHGGSRISRSTAITAAFTQGNHFSETLIFFFLRISSPSLRIDIESADLLIRIGKKL